MSQVFITFGAAPSTGRAGDAPVMHATGSRCEEVTSSGTSQATTITANANDSVCVENNGDDTIWITFAASPTAVVGTTHPVMPNTSKWLGSLGQGMKAAVINDS